ncbi:MAG: preprotein translocase subunit SecY [Desulfobacula sp.]|jgi:preprotein translocase subunit SecY|uniref:preprotein translocase subunit SecY n=1 Tax=Desulfobacula sp. TaxID=2593537 RepID=UPI001D1C8D3A|nr:preprotein translocase subunit SecY [Desulfobacula sp.]MBT3484832.1 preprotein translocase subunit SecY [Desulfobacula sp.]MBT3804698.1 preprotein translocase subunit SecY [Desulfobacula sp.]MBT4024048.1 preprotein translocase subunit SecY [Desulfobacula sp.]MBT4198410.1 preprotein translocase subunit SecY [Desulfobacula sp.]
MIENSYQNLFKLPELKRKIFITLALLFVYRVGIHVPTPGVDGAALSSFFASAQGTLFSMFNMFSGGALERFSIFALGIMPYISASIILELMTVVVPHLAQLKKEGDAGRKKKTQYTRYGTVLLSIIQGLGISVGLESMTSPAGVAIVPYPGWAFRLVTIITLTAGTSFIMWLGEQITERGIGNGISLIIFAGIVAQMPSAMGNTIRLMTTGEMGIFLLIILIVLMVAVIAAIIYMEQAQRRIPVHYAKRVVGRKMYGGQTSHLPLKINTAGVIPPIFASSIIMFPTTLAQFTNLPVMTTVAAMFSPGTIWYYLLYVGFIIFFCFFYTAVQFNPEDVAENMKKNGGYIPGIRPGKRTSEYIDRVLTRITLGGALYVSAVCVLPTFLMSKFNVPFYFGGTALLIVVGVAIDTISQIESHLISGNYEGFLGRSGSKRIKGRS